MNRALLKQDAKDAMKAANPHPVLTTLVFWEVNHFWIQFLSFFPLLPFYCPPN